MKTTIAERILDHLLAGDGCAKRTARLGVDRGALVRRIGEPVRDRAGNLVGWTFADGSSILESGGGWDTPAGWAAQGETVPSECWCCGEPATATEPDSGDPACEDCTEYCCDEDGEVHCACDPDVHDEGESSGGGMHGIGSQGWVSRLVYRPSKQKGRSA